MNDIEKRLAALSPEKRKLFLQQLNHELSTQRSDLQQILPQSRGTNTFPLSYSQKRLWFLDQLEPGNAAYNIPIAIHLKGNLNLQALENSLSEIVRRHEFLRTTFVTVMDEPLQVINPPEPNVLMAIDLQSISDGKQETEVQQLISEEALRPFDLKRGPLLRTTLLKLGKEDHVLLITMHHIVSDGWSIGLFVRELGAHYQFFCGEQSAPLPELPVQYVDFSKWQQEWLEGEILDAQLGYWKTQLKQPLPTLNLSIDYSRPKIQTFRGAKQTLELSQSVTEALKELSRQEGCTLFMTMLTAFNILLYRQTGQSDIIIGSPIAGRNRAELENLIGFFLNTLALRVNLDDNPSFRELLKKVREVALAAYANQDIPFEKLLEEIHPERDLSRTPIFQVFFNMLNLNEDAINLPGLTGEFISSPDAEAKFDLTLYITEQNQKIQLILVYNAELFSPERMWELARQMEWLLKQIIENPGYPIDAYSLRTLQSQEILPDPSKPIIEPKQLLLPQMIKEWVKRTPNQLAIIQDDQHWTYAELDERASTMARLLIHKGLKPGDVVAVCGSRSLNLIASMIGVFISGGVLLSVDRDLPDQRKQLMLREAQAKALIHIGKTRNEDMVWAENIAPENRIFADSSSIHPSIEENTKALSSISFPQISGDSPAYIFFTSGTTGTPKGVLGLHKGLGHFIRWQRDTFGIHSQDRAAQLTALSFDVVLRDIFLALASGAALCLPQDHLQLHSEGLLRWLQKMRISVVHTVPTLAQTWLADIPAGISLPDLRWVFFAGEPLNNTLVRRWRLSFPNSCIVNLYGPTETTMAKCFYLVPDDPAPGVQPVGQPIPQTEAIVINKNGQLSGIGELGEIVIRTPFRTLGYINAPEENLRKFIKNPFRDDENDKLYFTGDQGRFRPDGQLEITGRMDGQVKIRGIRIELGEIESAIDSHPAVRQSVVSVWQVKPEDKRLIAYFVPNPLEFPRPAELRSFLQKKLPDHMIPAGFILLNEIPLTPNGKINRQSLPSPELSGFETERRFAAPVNELEELVANIWADVLGVEKVSVLDSFFELGGHSLLMTQIISRIFRIIRVELPLRDIFENPTVRELAQKIESARLANLSIEDATIQPISRSDNLPLSYSQERMWFLHQLTPDSAAYNVFAAARFRGPLNRSVLANSLKTIVQRHESLRTTFATANGQPIQVISSEPTIVLSIIDLQNLSKDVGEAEVLEILKSDARKPFDLARGPLLRTSLLQLSADEHILALTMHHSVSDQWSMGIFTKELINLYAALDSNQEATLPDLPIQYADFANWQRESLPGKTLQTRLNYWKKQLQGLPVLELPTDKSRPSIQTYNGARQVFPLSPQLINGMRILSQSEQVTQFMVVLTVFNILLCRYTGQEDIAVGMPTANRDRVEIEPLIGTFVNTLVLRTDLSGNPTFKELLQKVRYTVLDALANKDLPFAKLVEATAARPRYELFAADPGFVQRSQYTFRISQSSRFNHHSSYD